MTCHPICFTAELADVPFEVRCKCHETEECFKEYHTDKTPEFVIDFPEDECAAFWEYGKTVWERFDDPAAVYGMDKDAFIENGSIQWSLCRKLSDYDVFYLHGSAICLDGEAYLFTAPPGTGKSTHTRLWREAFGERAWMINDDRPYIRLYDDHVRVYGSPWMGKHHLGCNGSAPLKAGAWLLRGNENHIEPLAKPAAFPVLLREAQMLSAGEWIGPLTGQLKRLLDMVPFYRLYCNMEPEAAYISMRGMKSNGIR